MFEYVVQSTTALAFLSILFHIPVDTDDDKSYARKLSIIKLTAVVLLICLVATFFKEIT